MEAIFDYRTLKQCIKRTPKHHGIKYDHHEMRNDLSRDSSLPTPLLSHSMLLHQDVCLRGKCKGHEWLTCGLRICISRRRHWASWLITGVADHYETWSGKTGQGIDPTLAQSQLSSHCYYLLIYLLTYSLIYLLSYLLTHLFTYSLIY